jgi:hypothetical protein
MWPGTMWSYLLAHLLRNWGLFQENSLTLYGFRGITLKLCVGIVLQESGDLLVLIRSTHHHGDITFVSRKYGAQVIGL